MNKARRMNTPAIPDSQLFDVPADYTRTLKNYLFYEIITRQTRMLVFASDEQLKLLFNSSIILMDGTFSSSPTIFSQVYCIHAIKYEQCKKEFLNILNIFLLLYLSFVCVFALLPDKKKSTYKLLFHELYEQAKQLNLVIYLSTVMSDFEGSLVDIIKSEMCLTVFQT